MAIVFALLLCSPFVRGSGCPDTDPDALGWLAKMSHSLLEVDYHGVVTFERGDETQVMNISHSVASGSQAERMARLTGDGTEVVRAAHPLECIHPGHQLLQLGVRAHEGECGIARSYRVEVGSGDRVAGREAIKLSILPRDMYRYGYNLALDTETGLLLRIQTTGRGGVMLERFQFASLDLDPGTARRATGQAQLEEPGSTGVGVANTVTAPSAAMSFAPPAAGTPATVAAPAPVHEAGHPEMFVSTLPRQWQVRWLPTGFTSTEVPGAGRRQTFTDGLAVFSVFIEHPAGALQPGEGVVRIGSTTTYVRGLQLGGSPVLATLIGEVPLNTARMVVDSIAPKP